MSKVGDSFREALRRCRNCGRCTPQASVMDPPVGWVPGKSYALKVCTFRCSERLLARVFAGT